MAIWKLIFLPHTHWDREWYLPFEVFREKLVQLIDGLVKILLENPNYTYFLLDGQAIVLDDYVETRGRNQDLARLIKEGRIGIGPWYVLPDEFLVSGEALIRNLKKGFEISRQWGVEPVKIGYLPDMFGHISQMPQILRGFGIDSAVVWRGVPKMDRNQFRWQSRDGSSVLALYLPLGYGMIFDLGGSAGEFLKKLNLLFPLLKMKDESGVYLVMIGTDHWFPEANLPVLLKDISEMKKDWQMEIGTLEGFFSELKARLSAIPSFCGELRSNEQSQILPSVASSRLYLKEMNHRASAMLEKYLEPLSALNFIYSGADWVSRLDYLWKLLLQNHPHDSICGCSVDAVHSEMEIRFKKFFELAGILITQAQADLACADGFKGDEVCVWNPNPGAGASALVFESELFNEKNLFLEDSNGRRYLLERVERINSRELLYKFEIQGSLAWMAFSWLSPEQVFGLFHNSLSSYKENECLIVELGVGTHNLNFPIKKEFSRLKDLIEKEKISVVEVRIYREPRWKMVSVVNDLPGPGVSNFKVGRATGKAISRIRVLEKAIENELLKVSVDGSGGIRILDFESGKELLMQFSDRGDRGDSYNFDPVPGEEAIIKPEKFKVREGPKGVNFASLDISHSYRIPLSLDSERKKRVDKKVLLNLDTRVFIYSGIPRVDFETGFENPSEDHRLQVDFWYPELADYILAESQFELVKRRIEKEVAPKPSDVNDIFGILFGSECRYSTSPVQNFCCLQGQNSGMILAGRGLKELGAEKDQDGKRTRVSFTLCRSIGYLARADLVYRNGLAGPPLLVRDAQCLRRFNWNYSLMFFSGPVESAGVFSRAYQFVFPALVFPGRAQIEFPFQIKSPKILLSAFYPGKDQRVIVRLFNSSSQSEKLEMGLGNMVTGVRVLSLEEKEITRQDLRLSHNLLEMVLKPWEILTLGLEISRKEKGK